MVILLATLRSCHRNQQSAQFSESPIMSLAASAGFHLHRKPSHNCVFSQHQPPRHRHRRVGRYLPVHADDYALRVRVRTVKLKVKELLLLLEIDPAITTSIF